MYLTMYKGYKIICEGFTYKIMQGRITCDTGFNTVESCKKVIDNY
jgi:hypothetical protein